jgi:hypothetical protein
LGSTVIADSRLGFERAHALPFGLAASSKAAPTTGAAPDGAPDLTVKQHASLSAELEAYPHHREQVLRKYGILDAQASARLETSWKARLAADAQLLRTWHEHRGQYRDWLARTKR